ncbi:glycosyltransferase family 4 protein [Candidatus Uhrbacteria bacterium]|nr:glycosyltransferase family 4 protein [Candidatus Uhrbacteria bacterium]
MNIGIDARMSGPTVGGGGLGRYVEQLICELPNVDSVNRYVLFGKEKAADIPWYTLKEQILLPAIIDREHLDLIHFPHWNVPILLKTPFVVTIHDLILLEEPKSARATTRHPIVYALKYAGFKRVLAHSVSASKKIITVSEATKRSILTHFPNVSEKKIVVIYEGVSPLPPVASSAPLVPDPFLLCVGNAYPHKNLDVLLRAFDQLHVRQPEIHLVFAGRDDVFSRSLQKRAQQSLAQSHIHFIFSPNDEDLSGLYHHAKAYLFPSRIEGFGLPALEAMAAGVPVIASAIPALKEILGDSALFFPVHDPSALALTIEQLLNDPQKQQTLVQKGFERIKRYSWTAMARQTVQVYTSCDRT